MKLLLAKGAAVDLTNSIGWTALLLAACGRHEAVVKLLLEKGAAVDLADSYGWTALHWAAAGGHEAVMRLLRPSISLASGTTPW